MTEASPASGAGPKRRRGASPRRLRIVLSFRRGAMFGWVLVGLVAAAGVFTLGYQLGRRGSDVGAPTAARVAGRPGGATPAALPPASEPGRPSSGTAGLPTTEGLGRPSGSAGVPTAKGLGRPSGTAGVPTGEGARSSGIAGSRTGDGPGRPSGSPPTTEGLGRPSGSAGVPTSDARAPADALAEAPGGAPAAVPAAEPEVTISTDAPRDGFGLQLGAYQDESEARALVQTHADALVGQDVHLVEARIRGKGVWYRVRVGRFETRADAEAMKDRLPPDLSGGAIVVRYR